MLHQPENLVTPATGPQGNLQDVTLGEVQSISEPVQQVPMSPVVSRSTSSTSVYKPPLKLALITCHFNPCGFEAPRQNFLRFVAALELLPIPWFAIELAFDDQPFALPERPEILRRRTKHVLWQKERLLNELIRHVPTQYERLAWVDADIVFTNPRWPWQADRLLDTSPIVQLFETTMPLDQNGVPIEYKPGVALRVQQNQPNAKNLRLGHPGYAWAARRSLLERHGLYDRDITGGGDAFMVRCMYGWFHEPIFVKFAETRPCDLNWAYQFHADVKGQVGIVPGTVQHLWHGSRSNRQYIERRDTLIELNYNPERDIRIGSDGLWEWTGANPALEAAVRQFFLNRREDG